MKKRVIHPARIFFILLVVIFLFNPFLFPRYPGDCVIKIDKTAGIDPALIQYNTLNSNLLIIQELNTCYLGISREENLNHLSSQGISFCILDASTTKEDRLYLVSLVNFNDLPRLEPYGIAMPVEGNIVYFRPLESFHPREMFPDLFRGIKKLGNPVKIGIKEPSPRQREAALTSKQSSAIISQMANAVSKNNLKNHIQTLQDFVTREATTNGCKQAGTYIYNTLSQYLNQVEYDPFNFEGYQTRNVIGYLPGKTQPSSVVIISAHYDSYAEQGATVNAPGADDNASGTATVLESARIMSGYSFNYTIKFILFSAEEWGLYGSEHYARLAEQRGENIIGVINLDMVSFADYLPEDLDVIMNSQSKWMGTVFTNAANNYSSIDVKNTVDGSYYYSDHASFWDYDFPAVLCIEDYEDTNPYYHSKYDTIDTINLDFATQSTKVCLATTAQLAQPQTSTSNTLTITSPNGGENWTAGSTHSLTWTSTGTVGNVKIEYTKNNGSSWSTIIASTTNDGSYSWKIPTTVSSQCKIKISEASDGNPSDTSDSLFSISSSSNTTIVLNRTGFYFCALTNGLYTSSQQIWISKTGGTINWQATANASWLSCTPSSGTNHGIVTVSINPSQLSPGNYNSSIAISAPGASNSPQTIPVLLTVKRSSQDSEPWGEFSTPLEGSTVSSSIPVTGWALDDVEIQGVKIYIEQGNSLMFIGDAGFVEGARPDVETAYPGYPFNYKAGWGYMMLTNFLPNHGNGVFVLHAQATDNNGHTFTLGTKTITVDNIHAVKPFGAIDTPAPNGIAAGKKYINWGWALTPQPNHLATNGSGINVWVDGVNKGHPHYNISRSDIASFFPGYANSQKASGYYSLDTTTYSNGLHSIQWTATDNAGNTDGIGSRFFLIYNSTSSSKPNCHSQSNPLPPGSLILEDIPTNSRPIQFKHGYHHDLPQTLHPNPNHIPHIFIKELEPICINLSGNLQDNINDPVKPENVNPGHVNPTNVNPTNINPGNENSSDTNIFYGALATGNQLNPLPIGSTLIPQEGVFYWQPGPGFIGSYHLVFIKEDRQGRLTRQELQVTIIPKYPVSSGTKKQQGERF